MHIFQWDSVLYCVLRKILTRKNEFSIHTERVIKNKEYTI